MAFPEAKGKNIADNTELLFLKGDGETTDPDDEGLDSVELEAKLAAVRIREMTDPEHGMDIYDGALGDYRKAGYKDIVILLRPHKPLPAHAADQDWPFAFRPPAKPEHNHNSLSDHRYSGSAHAVPDKQKLDGYHETSQETF